MTAGAYEEYEWPPADGNDHDPHPDYASLFDAPDFAKLIRGNSGSATAKEYAAKTRSILKTGILASLRGGNVPDAATLLYYGPEFAMATGELAAANDRARKVMDMITSPDAPLLVFGAVAATILFQFARNREQDMNKASATRQEARAARKAARAAGVPREKPAGRKIEIGLPFGRKLSFTVRLRLRFPLGKVAAAAMRAQTQDPRDLATKVFSDPRLIAELRKQGIPVVVRNG